MFLGVWFIIICMEKIYWKIQYLFEWFLRNYVKVRSVCKCSVEFDSMKSGLIYMFFTFEGAAYERQKVIELTINAISNRRANS